MFFLIPDSSFRFARGVLAVAACLAATGADARTNDASSLFTLCNGLPRHTAEYAPRRLLWSPVAAVPGVRAVYPHPAVSATVYVTAADGLYRSDDEARTWRRLPLAGLAEPGAVAAVAFRPGEPETLCLGTRGAGVWLTRDGGLTALRIGSKAAGMASDMVEDLVYAPADPLRRMVLAGHGKAAAGVSRGDTQNGEWSVVATGNYVHRIIPGNPQSRDFCVFASEPASPDTTGFYYAPMLAGFWQRLIADALLTDGAWLSSLSAFIVTTLDRGVMRVSQNGGTVEPLGGANEEWFSVATTWGSHADTEVACLYEPSRLGLVLTTNDVAAAVRQGEGLYRGSFVKEGAQVRPNAGGTRFYGVINGCLWVSRNCNPIRVDSVNVMPPEVVLESSVMDSRVDTACDKEMAEFAGAMKVAPLADHLALTIHDYNSVIPGGGVVRVRAHVVAPTGSVPVVTADLSRFGLSDETPMTAASNGVYETIFALTRTAIQRSFVVGWTRAGEWRKHWPGPEPITVSARMPGNAPAGAVGVLALYRKLETIGFGTYPGYVSLQDGTGTVAFAFERKPKEPAWYGPTHPRLDAGPGVWRAPLVDLALQERNVSDFNALTFLICGDRPAGVEIAVQLRDNPLYTEPTLTPAVPLPVSRYIAGGSVTTEFRRVTIPMDDLLKGAREFRTELCNVIVFTGASAAPCTYWLERIRFMATKEDLAREMELEAGL